MPSKHTSSDNKKNQHDKNGVSERPPTDTDCDGGNSGTGSGEGMANVCACVEVRERRWGGGGGGGRSRGREDGGGGHQQVTVCEASRSAGWPLVDSGGSTCAWC